ncbi:hypothetical protein PU629_16320 [Pullulanibacillus sp. KACC 23026]|uniref:hypothetical protein n=1 Tax=Pullulanibacillus sp. KACC 23026 TaxID=3028315 RepID=UPI0023AF669A|nr:hypothetical protein [Pullulanibacillus sp. KACC 23026]WEG11698.1 hypothetical protein PU629_16320 [Pullulanibacillus sp. KACC 23026]
MVTKSNQWWKIIFGLVNELDENNITYSFDASTSLFVNGIDNFDMEDLDIMIQWDCYEIAFRVFGKYSPTSISQKNGFYHFRFYINDLEIHLMSSDQINYLNKDPDRVCIQKDGVKIWSKSIHFYRRYTNNPYLKKVIDEYIHKTKDN